jgi:uncharacterized membrane protein
MGAGAEAASPPQDQAPACPGPAEQVAQAPSPSGAGQKPEGRWYWWGALIVVVAYIAITFALESIRFRGFYDETFDFGIFQQALWSGAHGGGFYNSPNLEWIGTPSFLQVHPSLMMFVLAAVYLGFPSAYTLFAIQSLVVGLAGVPLFLLTESVTGSRQKAFWCVLCFFSYVPLLTAQLYDFHLESFMPVELFTTFYLWHRGKYVLTVIAALIAMATLEVAPIIILAMVAFFLLPNTEKIGAWARAWWSAGRRGATWGGATVAALRSVWRYLRRPPNLFSVIMADLAIGVYLLLRLLQGPWISWITGGQISYSGTLWGLSSSSLQLSPSFFTADFEIKISYWFTAYALVLFIPLLKPRTFLVQVPWLAYTLFSNYPDYVSLGYQYGAVAAVGVFIGMAYGMQRVSPARLRALLSGASRAQQEEAAVSPPLLRRRALVDSRGQTLVLLAIISFGLLWSPINPLVQTHAIPESTPAGYWLKYAWDPAFDQVTRLADRVPTNAVVLTTPDLFPLVANNVNAYSTLWYPANPEVFPFNSSDPPQYVFVAQVMAANIPSWLQPMLTSTSLYVVVGQVSPTPVGHVLLYEYEFTAASPSPERTSSHTESPVPDPRGLGGT